MATKSVVAEKTFAFAVEIVNTVRGLQTQRRAYVPSRQVSRSGTGIGANIQEALVGQRRPGFIAKMATASQETSETGCWLRLPRETGFLEANAATPVEEGCRELSNTLTAIVKTSQET